MQRHEIVLLRHGKNEANIVRYCITDNHARPANYGNPVPGAWSLAGAEAEQMSRDSMENCVVRTDFPHVDCLHVLTQFGIGHAEDFQHRVGLGFPLSCIHTEQNAVVQVNGEL